MEGFKVKKLLALLVVLALAGVANAFWNDDFESYSHQSLLVGQNNWTTLYHEGSSVPSGRVIDSWGRNGTKGLEEDPAHAGSSGGAAQTIVCDWDGSDPNWLTASIDYMHTADQTTYGQGFLYLGDESMQNSTTDYNQIWLQVDADGTAGIFTRINGLDVQSATIPSVYDPGTHGWIRLEIVVNLGASPSAPWAKGYFYDIEDSTGAVLSTLHSGDFSQVPSIYAAGVRLTDQGWAHEDNFTTEWELTSGGPDFDHDWDVDGVDFGIWQANYPTASGASNSDGDADYDGDVDGVDFGIWQSWYPYSDPNFPPAVPGPTAVPESATLGVLLMGGLVLLRGRRQR